jgi:SagB-type dehydrogenase family enzyme
LRAAPSAGALYPIETYVVVGAVRGIEPGVYHYGPERHELDVIKVGDFGPEVARAALDQRMAARASVVFAWTAVFERSKWKYKQRAYRYVYLDAGHIAQNVALAAVALGLGSCQIAALYDDEANGLLEVDGSDESTLYMTAVGRPA